MASRSSLLRRPTARGLYFSVGLAGSPGAAGAPGGFAAGPMLPEGVRFLSDWRRWTGARPEADGPGVGVWESPVVVALGAGLGEAVVDALARLAAPAGAPRRGAPFGGMMGGCGCG